MSTSRQGSVCRRADKVRSIHSTQSRAEEDSWYYNTRFGCWYINTVQDAGFVASNRRPQGSRRRSPKPLGRWAPVSRPKPHQIPSSPILHLNTRCLGKVYLGVYHEFNQAKERATFCCVELKKGLHAELFCQIGS